MQGPYNEGFTITKELIVAGLHKKRAHIVSYLFPVVLD